MWRIKKEAKNSDFGTDRMGPECSKFAAILLQFCEFAANGITLSFLIQSFPNLVACQPGPSTEIPGPYTRAHGGPPQPAYGLA